MSKCIHMYGEILPVFADTHQHKQTAVKLLKLRQHMQPCIFCIIFIFHILFYFIPFNFCYFFFYSLSLYKYHYIPTYVQTFVKFFNKQIHVAHVLL